MTKGRFGIHGGQYIPETLMNAVLKLEKAYDFYKNDPEFNLELTALLNDYAADHHSLLRKAYDRRPGRRQNLPEARRFESYRCNTRSIMRWGSVCWQRKWAKPV